jgi:hypothetical protein
MHPSYKPYFDNPAMFNLKGTAAGLISPQPAEKRPAQSEEGTQYAWCSAYIIVDATYGTRKNFIS